MTTLSAPPRPSGSSLLLALRFKKDPFSVLSELRDEHGDAFTLKLPGLGEWVFLCSPELVHELYKAPEKIVSASDFNYRFLAYLVGKNSFVAEEDAAHRFRRRPLTPFFNGKGATSRTDLIRSVVERHIDSWPTGAEIPLVPRAMELSLENLYRVITDLDDQATLDQLVSLTIEFFDRALKSPLVTMPSLQWNLGRFSPWGRILWVRKRLRALLTREIESMLAQGTVDDSTLLGTLFHSETIDGQRLDVDTIIDDLLIILNAGQETSSRITAWTIAGILANPSVQERLRSEIDEVLGDRPIAEADLQEMPYLDAIVQEGIRYQPLAPFIGGRVFREPFQIGNYLIPAQSIVVHAHAEICRRTDLFPNPKDFDPDKNFLGRDFKRGEWAPFGGGPRLCLGRGSALVQLKVILATLFQRLDMKLTRSELKAVPSGFLFVPEDGLPVEIVGLRN